MRKLLPTSIFIVLAFFALRINAQITIGPVETGVYGRGSSISVPISMPSNTNCLLAANVFQLYLSDQNGNFNNEIKIGEIGGFFSTHINGVIPAGTSPGTGYKLRVKTTSPQTTILYSGSVNIAAVSGPQVNVIPTVASQILSPETFGWCGSAVGDDKTIILEKAGNSAAQSITLKNMASGATQNYTPGAAGFNLEHLAVGYYTVTVRGTTTSGADQIKSVKTYLLLNVPSKVNIQSGGRDFGCIDPETGTGAVISYSVNITGQTGIQDNYPGSTYVITWGDGKEDRFTHCELMKNNGALTHNYTKTSCGEPPINIGNGPPVQNSFRVSVRTINAFCQSSPVSAYPKIFSRAIAHIDPATAAAACINTPVTFNNTSTIGNNSDCTTGMQWKWYVDGVLVSTEETFTYPGFTTPGIHTVKLVTNNDVGICAPSEDTRTVCVQNPPKPAFNFNGAQGALSCGPLSLKPTNTSVIDANCNSANTYLWTVTGGTVQYENGTNANSPAPEFRFTTPGLYKVSLSVNTASCGTVTTPEQTVIINGPPVATLSGDVTACNLTAYDFNNTTTGPTKTLFSGTQQTLADTYTWTITGGNYEFIAGTDLHSQYPKIDFKEYKTYTVVVVHKNNCNVATDTQVITFKPSPVVDPGSYTPICYKDPVGLQGQITGAVDSYEWVGGTGTFNPGRNALNAVYTPSDEERAAGKAELTLRANTTLAAPCNTIEGFVTLTIKPANIISSAAAKSICRGTPVDYTPAALTGSTFKWTVTNSSNASGFSAGSGTRINDMLTTADPAVTGTVTYAIVPVFDGCEGEPFELVVTITADPKAAASAANASICSGSAAGIVITTAQSGLKYLWTSTASGGQITGNTNNTATPSATPGIDDILMNTGGTAGTVTYSITPVNEIGCQGQVITVSVSVKPAPVISNNSITGEQSLCEGTAAAELTGTLPGGGTGIYSYQWQSSPDGTVWTDISGATDVNYNPGIIPSTTRYRRQVIIPNCEGTLQFPGNTITVTVNYNAKAEFSFVSDKGCIPFTLDAANITAADYPDRNGTYTWYANDVEIGQGINFPEYTINNENESVVIKLTVTSSKGCDPAEMSHTFTSEQTIRAAFGQDKNEGCGPLTVTFTNISTTLVNTTFTWDFGNGQTSSLAAPDAVSFLPDPTGKDKTYTVTLIATSACGISEPFTSTVLVRSAPKSMFSPDRTTGCSPLAINFSNTSPVAANTTYTFDFGDGSPQFTTNDRSNVTHTYVTPTLIKTFIVTMTTKGPCGEETSQHSIVVSPNTVAVELVVNGPDKRGCAPFTVPFFNNSTGADSFEYDFGDGSKATTISSPERVEHTFTRPGTYTISLTASNGCSTSSTSETITVLAQPEVSFSAMRNEDCTCLEVKFTNTSTDGVSYLWDFGDGVTSVETNPSHIYAATGVYNVKLTATNQNGCKDIAVNKVTVTGIPGSLFMPNSFIPDSPDPELRLFSAKGFGLKSWRFSIFNKWGEMIWETTSLNDGKPMEGWDGTFKGTQMPQGLYFWKADVQFLNGTGWPGMSYGGTPKRTGEINLIR